MNRENLLLIDGACRGAALSFAVVSLACLGQRPVQELVMLVWLACAVVAATLSCCAGWLHRSMPTSPAPKDGGSDIG